MERNNTSISNPTWQQYNNKVGYSIYFIDETDYSKDSKMSFQMTFEHR